MLWTKVELQGPPPACRLDFGMCQVSLFRSLTRVTDDQDLVTQVQQTKEILDRELKPGSASSRDSRQDTGSGIYSISKTFCYCTLISNRFTYYWLKLLVTKLSVKADRWQMVSSFFLFVNLSHIVLRILMLGQSYGPWTWNSFSKFSPFFIFILHARSLILVWSACTFYWNT